jgi:ankyrin repeat protein
MLGLCSGALLTAAGITLSFNAYAKQSVFLDSNGQPIPYDVLLQLSSGTNKNKIERKNTDSTLIGNVKSTAKAGLKSKKNLRPNPELEEELFHALKAGQTQRANQLLKMGTPATFKNYKGETSLGIAVSRGWASMVISLVENGADLKEEGARGVTLLHAASARGMTDVAKLLVKYGLNPSQKTDINWTPLHVAARYGHWQLVQYFLSVGVDPDIRNSDGKTALGLAQHLRHQGVIKILSPVTTRRSLDFSEARSKTKKKTSRKKKSKAKKSKRK